MNQILHTPAHYVRDEAQLLTGSASDFDEFLEMAADANFVLLGEASHGTREFYQLRADITMRLVDEVGFDAVAVEGDWPDIYRINRYVKGQGGDTAQSCLDDLSRFPRWMWRNRVIVEFVHQLQNLNQSRPTPDRCGFYGLDLYSLSRSAQAVIEYLQQIDPAAAELARQRYACMDHRDNPQDYGRRVALKLSPSCEDEVTHQLIDLLQFRKKALFEEGVLTEDEYFYAETNARLVRNAESYYRQMFSTRVNSWNLRDRHMADTLIRLYHHIGERRERPAKIVVWAHNSHLGDARATQMSHYGELNLGQLVRENYADKALNLGFTTYTGYVTAAHDWDQSGEQRWVRPALEDSVEQLFYRSHHDRFFLALNRPGYEALREPMLERAIGVVYRPETELQSHYFETSICDQFDAVIHLDETEALEPLDDLDLWRSRELPDTWPFGY